MPAPDTDPDGRDPDTIEGLSGYRPATRVWVYRGGSWRPGIVVQISTRAAMVQYRQSEGVGTSVDTVTAIHLAHREEPDGFLDRPSSRNNR